MFDFNMMTGRAIALTFFSISQRPDNLPSPIQDIHKRANFVDDFDNAITLSPQYIGQITSLDQSSFNEMLKSSTKIIEEWIKDVNDTNARKGIAFSLWSGCVLAGKTIALETRAGDNTSDLRKKGFTYIIDPLSKIDEFFKAGVEAAPVWKSLRSQQVSFDGVPDDSPVRVYKDTSYKKDQLEEGSSGNRLMIDNIFPNVRS